MNTSRQETNWRHWLVCPQCNAGLIEREAAFYCQACSNEFPHQGKVPSFVAREEASRARLDTIEGASMVAGYRAPNPVLSRLRRVVTSEYHPGQTWRAAKQRVVEAPGTKLIVGSGVTRYTDAVHLDIDDFPGVDLIADAANLPFADNSFSGVLCEVVLEHVAAPGKVVNEAWRVLKSDGLCFFVVPFLFPFHGHPGDYQRWSRQGLAELFRDFEDLQIGVHGGPTSALINILSEWAYVASGLSFPKGYTLIKGAVTLGLFPFKYLDLLIHRFPEAHRLAATLFVLGRKA